MLWWGPDIVYYKITHNILMFPPWLRWGPADLLRGQLLVAEEGAVGRAQVHDEDLLLHDII